MIVGTEDGCVEGMDVGCIEGRFDGFWVGVKKGESDE